MPCRLHLPLAAALLAGSPSLHAQEAVVGASDPDALFHSSDPKLNTNKQVAYHIVKDLLEAGHWELADKYLTERYIQHNPNAASGRAGVVRSEEHTSELQSHHDVVCRLLLEKKN